MKIFEALKKAVEEGIPFRNKGWAPNAYIRWDKKEEIWLDHNGLDAEHHVLACLGSPEVEFEAYEDSGEYWINLYHGDQTTDVTHYKNEYLALEDAKGRRNYIATIKVNYKNGEVCDVELIG